MLLYIVGCHSTFDMQYPTNVNLQFQTLSWLLAGTVEPNTALSLWRFGLHYQIIRKSDHRGASTANPG